jgi:hypothetical protein
MRISFVLTLAATLLLSACNRHKVEISKEELEASQKAHPEEPMEPILGTIDVPARGATVRGSMKINGWAVAKSGVDSVGIYIDRQFISYTRLGLGRPDVGKVFPMFPGSSTSGWDTVVDFSPMPEGDHVIQLQVTSKAGHVHDVLPPVPFKVAK